MGHKASALGLRFASTSFENCVKGNVNGRIKEYGWGGYPLKIHYYCQCPPHYYLLMLSPFYTAF
jgi:hypothetical protein